MAVYTEQSLPIAVDASPEVSMPIAKEASSTVLQPNADQVSRSLEGKRCSLRIMGKKRAFCGKQEPEPKPEEKKKKKQTVKKAQIVKRTPEAGALLSSSNDASGPAELEEKENGEGTADAGAGAGKSAYVRVMETIRAFNGHYLHFVQEEEQRSKQVEALLAKSPKASKTNLKRKDAKKPQGNKLQVSQLEDSEVVTVVRAGAKRASKRPDLKAISKMIASETVLYREKRIGQLPGIDVGRQFFSRAEMVVVGLHGHWLNGIDCMRESYGKMEQYKNKGYKFPLAVCIVLSGQYEDDLDNSEDVIYTGQGGHDLLGKKQQIGDQKMLRGNLALKNNMDCKVPVRVVRGHVSRNSYCGKVYTYDGLYQVQDYWGEKGLSGFTIFKYRLKRVDGQPPLTTNQVSFTRAQAPTSISNLRGLVCEDISVGKEKYPIPATNVVDDPSFAPSDFVYCKSLRVATNLQLPSSAAGCKCKGDCIDPRTCSCAKLNGLDFPYVRRDGGRLIEAKAVVFECGPNCGCSVSCINRTSQQGLKFRLEVFRTPKKGWAVRSWDTIPSGSPICEYTGTLMKADEIESAADNNYIFDIDCLQTMKGLDGRERRPGDVSMLTNFDDKKAEVPEYCIDAGLVGNIARFINHSCQPNLFVQCVLSSHQDIKMARVMLFAADNIPPLQELTYDYGYTLDSVVGPDGNVKKLYCYCGAADCRKRLY